MLARVLTAPFPFPYWHYFIDTPGADESELVCASLYQVELLFSQQTARMDTTAIIINPVLSEGGHVPPPPTFLQGLRVICNKHGLLLIIDEAQSGSGRMGQVFCIEYSEVKPDIMVIAKVRTLCCCCESMLSHETTVAHSRVSQMGSRSAPSSLRRSWRTSKAQMQGLNLRSCVSVGDSTDSVYAQM